MSAFLNPLCHLAISVPKSVHHYMFSTPAQVEFSAQVDLRENVWFVCDNFVEQEIDL